MNPEKLKICIAEQDDFSNVVFSDLAKRFEILAMQPNENLKDLLKKVDIFWFRLGCKIDNNVLDKQSKCKYLVTPVTGIDHIDEVLCKELGVNIICLRGEYEFLKSIRATAEHTIGLTFALFRNLADAIDHTKKGIWNRDEFRGRELYNKNVGIIGFGRLGVIVAGYFKAFGCNVGFYDILEKEDTAYKKYDSLETLLEQSDIVSIHVNYNEINHHFFGANHFEKMKKNAIFINTSRGGLVDEEAMLMALESRKISGAALDVLQGEPDIVNNKLIKYSNQSPNLIITPHIGGNTFESFEKTETFIFEKLMKTIDGK
ncbi:MAG TPA: D-isomer specific 2-hydroxyacid dehydrogenase family protein [Saprospiraceae bacterium]|nr:D-isomer specific 2-hydroxyacid dehydrogenase family protein [Saprospiraceae bacterium]